MKPVQSIALVLLASMSSCTARSAGEPGLVRHEGVELLAGLKSYSTPDAAKQQLVASKDWQTIFSMPSRNDERRPRFSQLTVDVTATECGQTGLLRLHFANELLYAANFTPADMEKCRDNLRATFSNLSEKPIDDGPRRYWIRKDADGRLFVGVSDIRLQEEVGAWVRAYS